MDNRQLKEDEVAVPHVIKQSLWMYIAEDGNGYAPFGCVFPTINGWSPPENVRGDYIPYPHGEETPEGPLRNLFGPRFPDLRAHIIVDGKSSDVPS